MDALQQRKRALDIELAEATAQRRLLRRNARRAQELPPRSRAAALAVDALAFPDMTAAAEFVVQRCGIDAAEAAAIMVRLRRLPPGVAAAAHMAATTHPTTPNGRAALRVAREWLAQRQLHEWIQSVNLHKSIAPVARVVMRQVAQQQTGAAAGVPLNQSPKWKGRLQWLRRFRRRWHISAHRLQAGDRVPVAEAQSKAADCAGGGPHYALLRGPKRASGGGPKVAPPGDRFEKTGAAWRSQNRDHCLWPHQSGVQKTAPYFLIWAPPGHILGDGGVGLEQLLAQPVPSGVAAAAVESRRDGCPPDPERPGGLFDTCSGGNPEESSVIAQRGQSSSLSSHVHLSHSDLRRCRHPARTATGGAVPRALGERCGANSNPTEPPAFD